MSYKDDNIGLLLATRMGIQTRFGHDPTDILSPPPGIFYRGAGKFPRNFDSAWIEGNVPMSRLPNMLLKDELKDDQLLQIASHQNAARDCTNLNCEFRKFLNINPDSRIS